VVLGYGVGGGENLWSRCTVLHGAITACSTDEFLDAPTGLVLDPVADGQCSEHNAQVRLDGIALVVVDRAGL
jgi:hypothetical protein